MLHNLIQIRQLRQQKVMIEQRAAQQRVLERRQKRMIDKAIKHYRRVNQTAVLACTTGEVSPPSGTSSSVSSQVAGVPCHTSDGLGNNHFQR